jgi:UDP-N-acetylglucosamine 2-epimerase
VIENIAVNIGKRLNLGLFLIKIMLKRKEQLIDVPTHYLPIVVNHEVIDTVYHSAQAIDSNCPVLAIVTGTKPDFYKQAPLLTEAREQNIPAFVIDTGQHYDDTLGYGLKEFKIEDSVGSTLQIRGDLMEKASELLLKFAILGKICKNKYPHNSILPIVHGDTLVAGISPLSWLFGLGQKVAQNEAGLRSMSPRAVRSITVKEPSQKDIEYFVESQFDVNSWFIARDEPFPEQVDTWICSAGTQYFFAPTQLNKENLVREGYPEENIFVVGNSVVDAIELKRKHKPNTSLFSYYPQLSKLAPSSTVRRQDWIRVDIHRRENLTQARFFAIVESVIRLVKMGYRLVLIKLTATQRALANYGLEDRLNQLEAEYPCSFLQTPLWKEYGHVIEFLDSGACWLELTDSGSMQEELLYFSKVKSITVRLNTDRPETIFEAAGNVLAPPVGSDWIVNIIKLADDDKIPFFRKPNQKRIYGEPGTVSEKVIGIIKKHFNEDINFYPWLHHRLGLLKENIHDYNYL